MNAPRLIMTSGVFDLLHRGHINLLWRAKQLGGVLVVGVVSDSGCKEYKGHTPDQNVQLRMQNVSRLGFVDVVEFQTTTDPSPLLRRFLPDVFCHGDDWARLLRGQETLEQLGVEFMLLPYTPGISTTQLRAVSA